MTGLNTVYKPDEYEIDIFDADENYPYDNFSVYTTIYKEYHVILTISDTGPVDMRESGPGGALVIVIESSDPWHQKRKDGREYRMFSHQVEKETDNLVDYAFEGGAKPDNIIAQLEILKTYLLDKSAESQNEHSTFSDNILSIDGKKIKFQREIWKTIEDENHIYVLLKFPMEFEDYKLSDLHNIYAYTFEGESLWNANDKPDENSKPYVMIRDDVESISALDFVGKRFKINKSTGAVAVFEDKA
jgi:hypothetical protein